MVPSRRVVPSIPDRSHAGFALVEVMVSAVIVLILASGTLFAISATKKSSAEERHRATAHGIAQEDQGRMRGFRISALSNYTQERTVQGDDGSYTVSSRAEFVTDATGTASCEEDSASADYIRISSSVTWPSIGARPPVLLQSIVTPPNGSIAANRGALAVSIRGGQGQPIPGVQLSGTGPGSFSGTTSENGCVIFGNLPVGNYALTVNLPGYVNQDGQPAGIVNTSVADMSTNTLALQLDEPGGVDVSFTTRKQGQIIPSSYESIVAFNTGMTVAKVFSRATPVATLSAEPLFPFASPTTVFAGGCEANNPNPGDVVGAPGAAAQASVPVLPDQIAAAQIQLPSLDLRVRSGTSASSPGTPVSAATVILTDSGCAASGQTVKIRRTTDTSGGLTDPGLPWSTYSVCVGKSGKRSITSNVQLKNLNASTVLTVYLGAAATGTCT